MTAPVAAVASGSGPRVDCGAPAAMLDHGGVYMQLLRGALREESSRAREVRRGLEAEGYRVEFWSAGPGAVLSGLHFESDGIVFIDSGSGTLEVEGREIEVSPGDQVLVPKGSFHTLRNGGKLPLTWLVAMRLSVEGASA